MTDTVSTPTDEMSVITSFEGNYAFLSNFYKFENPISLGGFLFKTVEHAFQAAKTKDNAARERIAKARTPAVARQISRMSVVASEWKEAQDAIMDDLLKQKFAKNAALVDKLLETQNSILINGNTWNDRYWGMEWDASKGAWSGENRLGRKLMELRQIYRTIRENCKDGDCND